MRRAYVDSSHHVALLNPDDDRYEIAADVAHELDAEHAGLVTSDAVLIVVLTFCAGWGRDARRTDRGRIHPRPSEEGHPHRSE